MFLKKNIIWNVWLLFFSIALSVTWLLLPSSIAWSTLNAEVWISICLWVGTIFLLLRKNVENTIQWHWPALVIAILALIPFIQFQFGLIAFFGVAWVKSTFLIGFLFAILVGAYWESLKSDEVGDFLFLSICISALISVGLQMYQWLGFKEVSWILQDQGRPYANMGQPNMLASLLISALLGVAWFLERRKIRPYAAISLCAIYLVGIVLTQSRTGFLNTCLVLFVLFFFGWKKSSKKMMCVAVGLFIFFVICVFGVGPFSEFVGVGGEYNIIKRVAVGERLSIWKLFGEAILARPFFGYGWGGNTVAQIDVMLDYPITKGILTYAHNIFLDFFVWLGIPGGVLLSLIIIYAYLKYGKDAFLNEKNTILYLFLLTFGIHSLLEFPLAYAYFLLPFGMVLGALTTRLRYRPVWSFGVPSLWLLWGGAGLMLLVTIRDSLEVERIFKGVKPGEIVKVNNIVPDVMVLNQWWSLMLMIRADENIEIDEKTYQWMNSAVMYYPNIDGILKLAKILATNGKKKEAENWLEIFCKLHPGQTCLDNKMEWEKLSETNSALAQIKWPAVEE